MSTAVATVDLLKTAVISVEFLTWPVRSISEILDFDASLEKLYDMAFYNVYFILCTYVQDYQLRFSISMQVITFLPLFI